MKFDVKKIAASLDAGYLDATALVEYLVAKGVAFRQAHGIVGAIVAECEKGDKKLADLSLGELRKHSPVIAKDVYGHLGAGNVVRRYVTEGAAGKGQAKAQIKYWQERLVQR